MAGNADEEPQHQDVRADRDIYISGGNMTVNQDLPESEWEQGDSRIRECAYWAAIWLPRNAQPAISLIREFFPARGRRCPRSTCASRSSAMMLRASWVAMNTKPPSKRRRIDVLHAR